MNRTEAVDTLKDVLAKANIGCPNMFNLQVRKPTGYKITIRTSPCDRLILRNILVCSGLTVDEEGEMLVIT